MEKLYYTDTLAFDAVVTSCEPGKKGTFFVTLDRTAFYPEGGGQPCDRGTLCDAGVIDVQEKDGAIVHTVTRAFAVGETVHGVVDAARRRDLTQQHSGEHILSGLLCAKHHANNVGFHLSDDVVTVDFDVELTSDDIAALERAANEIVQKNVPIHELHPDAETLETLPYRSKKELTGDVRLIEIPGADLCACCGTHVKYTGEVGLIKVLSHQRYKGGVRMTMVSGMRALADYAAKHETVSAIAVRNSCKPEAVASIVEKCEDSVQTLKIALAKAEANYCKARAAALPADRPVLLFEDADCDCQKFALTLAETVPVAAVFAGTAGSYRYALAAKGIDLRTLRNAWNEGVSGKGGGSDVLMTGKSTAAKEAVEQTFAALFSQRQP